MDWGLPFQSQPVSFRFNHLPGHREGFSRNGCTVKVEIEGSSLGLFPGLPEGNDLGMIPSCLGMVAFSTTLPFLTRTAPTMGLGEVLPFPFSGKTKGSFHPLFIFHI